MSIGRRSIQCNDIESIIEKSQMNKNILNNMPSDLKKLLQDEAMRKIKNSNAPMKTMGSKGSNHILVSSPDKLKN